MSTRERDVLLELSGKIATVTINRPESRNTLLTGTATRVYDALREVAANPDISVLIFRGQGSDFCCGADVKQTDSSAEDADRDQRHDHKVFDVTVLLHEMRPVTIAAIRGGCAGAGLGWAAACDLRVTAPDARFNTAFLDVGVAGDMAGPWLLPRLIGAGKARDLYFFPRKVKGSEAFEIGLVDRLFDSDTFDAELQEMVDRLARSAPLALAAMKSNFVEAERMGLSSYLALETARHHTLFATEDRVEAFKAFVEKRAPKFVGR